MAKTAFVTGGSSGIGQAVIRKLEVDGWEIVAPTHAELDLSNLAAVSS